jgi:hypothetical protein
MAQEETSVRVRSIADAIVAELPALQARLSEQHIPISSVAVTADAGGSSQGFQQSQQDGRSTAHYSAAMNNSSDDGSVREREAVSPVDVLGRGAGLDIRI